MQQQVRDGRMATIPGKRTGYQWLIRKLFTGSLLLLLLTAPAVVAAETGLDKETYDWKIPALGVLKAPVGLEAVEIKEVRNALKEEKPKVQSGQQAKSSKIAVDKLLDPSHPEAAMELATQLEMDGYQLTMDDGSVYHLAWMLAIRDRTDVGDLQSFFKKELEPEQLLQLDIFQQMLGNKPETYNFMDTKTKSGVKILEFYPLEVRPLADGQSYSLAVRMLAQAEDLKFPLYARAQVFNLGNQLAGAILLTSDS
ncbi:MAG TPA: hypothetical protein VN611_05775, partial [Patescibacteria group bacterium]|nr:hypothetical protein [Patescibacteria group bacterium]